MSIKVQNISIANNKIIFTIPQGTVVTKLFGANSGTYVLDKAYTYTLPLALGKINVNNNLWGPITNVIPFRKGTAPHLSDASKREIPGIQIYAKCTAQGQGGRFKVVKLGAYLKDTGTRYLEDFSCQDGSYQSALNNLIVDGKSYQIMINSNAIEPETNNTNAAFSDATTQSSEAQYAPKNAQEAIATVSKLNKGKGWIVGARESGWPEEKIQAYRSVINQYYAQRNTTQQQAAQSQPQSVSHGVQQQQQAQPQQVNTRVTQATAPAQPMAGSQTYTLNRTPLQYDNKLGQQIMQRMNADATKQKLERQQQQAKTNLFNNLDRMSKLSGAKDKAYAEQIKGFVNSGDYYSALATCDKLYNVAYKKQIRNSIAQVQQANAAQLSEEVQKNKERFYEILNRINNATILQ
jgi:hypothetical protein